MTSQRGRIRNVLAHLSCETQQPVADGKLVYGPSAQNDHWKQQVRGLWNDARDATFNWVGGERSL